VILSMHDSDAYVLEALRCGATGYVAKGEASTELARAVRAAALGRRYLRPGVPDHVIEEYLRRAQGSKRDLYDLLTRREREVLHLVAEGLSGAAIGRRLGISPRTVEAHRASLMRRLGLKGLPALIRYALSRGLVPPGGVATR
jgi:two-component system response regulator NreC